MKRPLADKRILGPFYEFGDPEPTGVEVRNGPIWTQIEATSYTGDRSNTPSVGREHVEYVDDTVKRIIMQDEVKERIEFSGTLRESDVFTDSYRDIVVTSFIRFPEDMISIRNLDEITDVLKPAIDEHEDLSMRSHRIVTQEFVEDTDPVITR